MYLSARGFTLVELLVVISIMAVMATVGIVTFGNVQQGARDSKRVQDVIEIKKSVEQYHAINGSYPQNLSTTIFQNTIDNLPPAGGPNPLANYFQANTVPKDAKSGSSGFGYYYTAGYTSDTCPSTAPVTSPRYTICAKLESCSGKCNRSALPTDGCATTTDGGAVYYCVGP